MAHEPDGAEDSTVQDGTTSRSVPLDSGSPSDRRALPGAVPPGMQIAGAWSWRILVVTAVLALVLFLIVQLYLVVIPVLIAVLIAALLVPLVNFLIRHHWPKWLAILVAELGTLAAIAGLVFLVVTQVARGFGELRNKAMQSYSDLQAYLLNGPFHITQAQFNDAITQIGNAIQQDSQVVVSGALSVGSSLGHVLTGLLLVLFSTLFILIDGRGIWAWVVGLFPRRARRAVDGAGQAGWLTVGNFVRVQILVAFIDAIGIGIGALILQVPLAIPIAVLVFLGSFVPVLGALFTGVLAVFIALVYNGPVVALIMLGVVILVQQIEGHVLQPLIMGTAVKVHPLAVVLAVGSGAILAGIPGTFFAVPVVAALNVMIKYIAQGDWREKPKPQLEDVVPDA
ncbi:AI-2E family transporter [Naasia lichenicola]|uniref:AI-2E family transporter n=1 Tax=Naasia lichenicola TaxID=2565933 RepID=A0A4S4FEG7_9MICO|nr:AI-2E family transporter [Naasia lichenicola]THG28418.1 AI-2E family transporter [Naasia lichenicola]